MDYQDAVYALNTLQSNGSVLRRVRRETSPEYQLLAMQTFLQRTGLGVDELNSLNIIHVTGTKGKGSTCAFTERILREYGFRTGFYSSPHLVQVRERIRINGQPISKELFTKYFWQVYGQLDATKDSHGGIMPTYFCFLTLLAFHVFLLERVDLAVIEVGIGGAYDCTNVIRMPWVCGISSLGLDHTTILGDTTEEIAWQKSGIFKPGVPAFTVKQPAGPLAVLHQRAKKIGCLLAVCPGLEEYEAQAGPVRLSLAGEHQHCNASLALQLSRSWLQRHQQPADQPYIPIVENRLVSHTPAFQPGPLMLKGLAETTWPGRAQTLRRGPVTYYLDGAHTTASILTCVCWFCQEAQKQEQDSGGPVVRVLLFNATGERDPAALLKPLMLCQFDFAVFCPNITESITSVNPDQQNCMESVENMLTRCLDNQNSWLILSGRENKQGMELLTPDRLPVVAPERTQTLVFPCILSALQWIGQGRDPALASEDGRTLPARALLREAAHVSVLVTGSLHLVGGVLGHLEPPMTC